MQQQKVGTRNIPHAKMCRPLPPPVPRPPPTSGPSASSNNKAVLEDVVKAIDAVARPNGPPLSTAKPTVPVTAIPTPAAAAASLASPAKATATSTAASTKQRAVSVGDGGAAASEANGVAQRQQPRFSDTAAAGGGGGAVEGGDGGKVSGVRADAGAGFVQPSVGATTTNAVLAAAAEVNRAGGNAGETARLSPGGSAAAAAGDSVVGASTGDETTAVSAAAASPRDNSRGSDAVAVEPGAPPTSMAEVRISREFWVTEWDLVCYMIRLARFAFSLFPQRVVAASAMSRYVFRRPIRWVGMARTQLRRVAYVL